MDPRYELAYDASVNGLAQQRERLSNLRTRASTIVAAAAIATSFLGAAALREDEVTPAAPAANAPGLDGWEIVAVGAFIGLTVLVVVILLPWRWKWHTNATALIRDYVEATEPATIEDMHRDLALHNERSASKNNQKLALLYWCFRGCCLLLALQVVAWIVDLGVA